MTEIPIPPQGYEVLEVEGDPDELKIDDLKFEGPGGEVLTYAEMVSKGLLPDSTLTEAGRERPSPKVPPEEWSVERPPDPSEFMRGRGPWPTPPQKR
jgi:hypothetical protein